MWITVSIKGKCKNLGRGSGWIRFAGIKGKVYCPKSIEDIMDMEWKTLEETVKAVEAKKREC